MSSRPITLELASGAAMAASADHRAALLGVVDDLVALLEAQFPASAEFPADALRMRLQQSRDRLRDSEHAGEAVGAGLRLVADASQAHARMAGHAAARDAEFLGIIRLLRELVDRLRGDAMAFRQDLMQSSERVADLTQLEDIRALRRALNREVDQLRQCVQQGERQEASRLAAVAGDLRRVDETIVVRGEGGRDGLLTRPALLAAIGRPPHEPAAIVVCRIDEPEAIIDGHGPQVLERVVMALAQLLKETFGKDAKVYRTSTQCVAMFLSCAQAKQVAQQVRRAQARVAPEYEYERQGVRRRVMFTFSSVITVSAGRSDEDAMEAFTRAEMQAATLVGLARVEVEASGLGRLVAWLSPGRL